MRRIFAHASRFDLLVVGGVFALVVALIGGLAMMPRNAHVYLVNGFDMPLTVEVGKRSVEVPAGGRERISVPAGVHRVKARTADGRTIESSVLHADPSADAVVYNPAGAAPVYVASITYAQTPQPEETTFEFYGGQRHLTVLDADYFFEEPPKSLTMSSKEGSVTKTVVGVGKGAWMATASRMWTKNETARGAALVRDILAAEPESIVAVRYAADLAYRDHGEGAVTPTLTSLLGAAPPGPELDGLTRNIVHDACRYRTCADGLAIVSAVRPSDSLTRDLLVLRALPEEDLHRRIGELTAAHPAAQDVARAAGRLAYLEERWTDCVKFYQQAAKLPDAVYDLADLAMCLYREGRQREALEALAAAAQDPSSPTYFITAVDYARLATRMGDESPMRYLAQARRQGQESSALMDMRDKLWAGTLDVTEKVPPTGDERERELAEGVQLVLDMLQGPEKAMAAASKNLSALPRVPDSLIVALGAEIARTGDFVLARRVLAAASRYPLSDEATFAYLFRGLEHPLMYRLEPEHRAALELVRARRLDELGRPSQLLYASARRRDVRQGWPTRLIEAWPLPRRSNVVVYGAAMKPDASPRR